MPTCEWSSGLTEELAHVPLIFGPDIVDGSRNAEDENEDIGSAEIGEEVVGEMLQIVVLQDDEEHDEVTDETGEKNENVDDGEEDQRAERLVLEICRVPLDVCRRGEIAVRHDILEANSRGKIRRSTHH